jgi:tetratricopeptide (TPR) repeat protein
MSVQLLAEATRLEESERNFEGAITLLKELIRRDPNSLEAYIHLAADSGILRRFAEAEQYARHAAQIDPTSGRARYYLACALRDQGRLDEAYPEMEQALVLVKQAAVKGTRAEGDWERFPLFGWNQNVERDAMNLRARMMRREFVAYREKAGLWLGTQLRRFRKTHDADQAASPALKLAKVKTYRNEQLGFEIDIPEAWRIPSGAVSETPSGYSIIFDCGANEGFNLQIGSVVPQPLDQTEIEFRHFVQRRQYDELKTGRIVVRGQEHLWASYCMGAGDRTKKYLLVFDETEYAITATCFDRPKFAETEKVWDKVITSFRPMGPTTPRRITSKSERIYQAALFYERGSSYFRAGRYQEALLQFEQGQLVTHEYPSNLLGISMTLMQMVMTGAIPADQIASAVERAEKSIQACLLIAPSDPNYLAALRQVQDYKRKYNFG